MQANYELGATNPADAVWRCAGKNCDKSFQGHMPDGWKRLGPDAASRLAQHTKGSESHSVLCPKHAQDVG